MWEQEVVEMTTATAQRVGNQVRDTTPRSRIVVGVDGSEQSVHALRWALDRARVSGELVEPVYVYSSIPPADVSGFGLLTVAGLISDDDLAEVGRKLLVECVERTADADATKGIAINPRLVESQTPVAALAEAAAGASMLVLGVHRRHWMDGAIGSTAKACLKHASCAVVVVPETAT
jgi:nucleotide-binding universal stress UspA family protein